MLKALLNFGYEYDRAVELAFYNTRKALKVVNKLKNDYKQNNTQHKES